MRNRDALDDIHATICAYKAGQLTFEQVLEDLELILEAAGHRRHRQALGDLTHEHRSWDPTRPAFTPPPDRRRA